MTINKCLKYPYQEICNVDWIYIELKLKLQSESNVVACFTSVFACVTSVFFTFVFCIFRCGSVFGGDVVGRAAAGSLWW
jgi:hypothetical protein